MSDKFCPNINSCRMVSTDAVVPDEKTKEQFIDSWCRQDEDTWLNCKRFNTKKALSFCPDFVVPDTSLSIDEIVEKFENNN
ncbi:MAG: hypothetical protein KAI29_31990 [Cyclobacteriaceae bacterium]|nr:hypothetical protein [Cyclobacteriaceae bacterium]